MFARHPRFVASTLAAGAIWLGLSAASFASCEVSQPDASLDDVVERVTADQIKYIFVGERHGIGPVKRFVVDLSNALLDGGYDVGLYVEGFRRDCSPRDDACWSLARAFNQPAFVRLLDEARAPVHAIDPPEADRRAAKMAASIADGSEAIRIVLVGRSHVVYAEDPVAELWVFGGGVRYLDPGDVVKAFPRNEYLTFGLETAEGTFEPYSVRRDGCAVDYVLTTSVTGDY